MINLHYKGSKAIQHFNKDITSALERLFFNQVFNAAGIRKDNGDFLAAWKTETTAIVVCSSGP